MVFLENLFIPLVILHLLITILLIGGSTHNLYLVVGYVRNKFGRLKQEKFFNAFTFWSYLFVYISGALIYPAWGTYIRNPFFDSGLPWATGLFEVKEHWGAVGLAIVFGYYILRKSFDPEQEKNKLALYIPTCFILNLIIWYKVIVGSYLSILKGTW
jgi:uncharacterized membrane protein